MRVAFDGRALTAPAAGVKRYICELVKAMSEVAPDVQMIAVGANPRGNVPSGVSAVSEPASLPTNLAWSLTGCPSRPAA